MTNPPNNARESLIGPISNMARARYQKVGAEAISRQLREDMDRLEGKPAYPIGETQRPQSEGGGIGQCKFCNHNSQAQCPTCGQGTACRSCQAKGASLRAEKERKLEG